MSMSQEVFKNLLREKGLKITTQRLLVLEILATHRDKHLTAEEIYELAKIKYNDIGLATVYRTIQLLLELNLIDRINLDDGFVRYEIGRMNANVCKHHHHHLICLSCGKITSFEDDLLDSLEARIHNITGFQVVDHEVKLYGYCMDCKKKQI